MRDQQKKYSIEDVFSFLDDAMHPTEKENFLAAVKENPELKKLLDEEKLIRSYFKSFVPHEPDAHFTVKVMERIQNPGGDYSISVKRSLLLLAGAMLVSLLTAFLVSKGIFDSQGTINITETYNGIGKYIPEVKPIAINNRILVNGILILNLLIGFVLLDRVVLRPLFQKRFKHT